MGKNTCNLECPKCRKVWATMKYEFDSRVNASDVKIIAGKKKKFKNGDALTCTLCAHEYSGYDVMLAIAGKRSPDGAAKI